MVRRKEDGSFSNNEADPFLQDSNKDKLLLFIVDREMLVNLTITLFFAIALFLTVWAITKSDQLIFKLLAEVFFTAAVVLFILRRMAMTRLLSLAKLHLYNFSETMSEENTNLQIIKEPFSSDGRAYTYCNYIPIQYHWICPYCKSKCMGRKHVFYMSIINTMDGSVVRKEILEEIPKGFVKSATEDLYMIIRDFKKGRYMKQKVLKGA